MLDLQVRHLDAKSCLGYGNWLSRRWSNCLSRKRQVISRLGLCGVLEETLQSEWVAQVVTQTRPAPRQSKHKADEEISKIIELEKLVHMNALAVKTRIRDCLRQRKFELERIERAYRQTVGVRGAVMPHYIPQEGLFELDVDDDIWQDVGLTGEWEATVCAMNEYRERGDLDVVYQLELWKEELECWVVGWKASVRGIPPMWSMSENWIQNLPIGMLESAGGDDRVQEDESEDWESEVGDWEDDELLEALEDWGLAEEYRIDAQPGYLESGMSEEDIYCGEDDLDVCPSSPLGQ
ncbi:hypothetical protein BDN67DRAFT_985516 [Paxillus ammoniavirescens]|nr:hypothetical protein BDN67DRAFT_985516 [Paxillus ammoniavirescens]